MTHEQRLDRLERIAKLFVKAGLRARKTARLQDEKINILIDMQIKHEELSAREHERFRERLAADNKKMAWLIEEQARNEGRFAKTDESFAKTKDLVAQVAETVRVLAQKRNSSKE